MPTPLPSTTTLTITMDFNTSTFTTAQEMYSWLREFYGLSVLEYDNYAIIHYVKGKSEMDMPLVQKARSVIWDTLGNKAVCVSPGRGFAFSCPPGTETPVVRVEEFVDGTMINMFWDPYQTRWRIATRTCLDGFNNFYGTRSFYELFMEAFAIKGLDFEGDFNRDCWYSFVLQHPEERIVVTTGTADLKLIATNDGTLTPVLAALLPRTFTSVLPFTPIRTVEDVKTLVGQLDSFNFQGVVFYLEGDSKRYKMRTPSYEFARGFRGNQAKLPYVWLDLWSQDRLDQYLEIYPEERDLAHAIVDRYLACVAEMEGINAELQARAVRLRDVSPKYKKLLWEFRQQRQDSLATFMKGQATARKLWLVNYDERHP